MVFLRANLERILPYQNKARSLALPCTIVHTDDPRKKTRRKANQYLTPAEEKALAQYLKHMADPGYLVPIKHL